MKKVRISEISSHVGDQVVIEGWLHHKRSSGKIQFLMVRDGYGLIQCIVVKSDVSPEVFAQADSLTQESSIRVTGKIREDSRAPGSFELDVTELSVLQLVSKGDPFPITPQQHSTEFLMDYRHLWIRSTRQRAILKIRHEIIRAVGDFFNDRGSTLFDPPILVANPIADKGFWMAYFDRDAWLAESGHLHLQAGAMALGSVYSIGPRFRLGQQTRRDLQEFWMAESAAAYTTLDDAMKEVEEMIRHIVQRVLDKRQPELKTLERDVTKLEKIGEPFPRITYDEAVAMLQKRGSQILRGGEFSGGDQTIISREFGCPVIVHRHPAEIKAIGYENDPDDGGLALSMVVMAPEGHGAIASGGQGVSDAGLMSRKAQKQHFDISQFYWYLDLLKYGSVPLSGFGMGIERAVSWICGLEHVREAIPFPRMVGRLTP